MQPALQPAKLPLGKITQVFLSATVKDVGKERGSLVEALRQRQTAVFLQDCWNRAAGDVVLMCCRELEKCSGYLGVFGFRYGWEPDGYGVSITELESEWAQLRWGRVDPPPVFVFTPQLGSPAAKALLERADRALVEEYPDDAAKREESKRRQKNFIAKLGQGRNIIWFKTLADLQVRACNAVALWNEEILESASAGRRCSADATIPLHELGIIGRSKQMKALEAALFAREQAQVLALCLVVHGSLENGLRAFREYLARWHGWDLGHDVEPGAPPDSSYDVQSLIAWAMRTVASGAAAGQVSIDALAGTIVERCHDEPVVLMLQAIEELQGGIASFHRNFWVPLHKALGARFEAAACNHRFSMVVISSSELTDPPPAFVWRNALDDRGIDYGHLLPLPRLGSLSSAHVYQWLRDYCGLPMAKSTELAKRCPRAARWWSTKGSRTSPFGGKSGRGEHELRHVHRHRDRLL